MFYSRDQPGRFFQSLSKQGKVDITCQACIKLEVIRDDNPPLTDWVFFSSPSGVNLFAKHFGLPRTTRLAVLGEGTERALHALGLEADFKPQYLSPQAAIQSFCESISSHKTVLIPRSTISLQRFEGLLSEHQLVDWPFYDNLPTPPERHFEGDVLIFTSPSNANAYFSRHKLHPYQRVVAIGNATFAALETAGISPIYQSTEPTEMAMWAAVQIE